MNSDDQVLIAGMLAATEKYDLRLGMAAICLAGGEATAVAPEREI